MKHDIEIKIIGMSCKHCARRVAEALSVLPGVRDIRVDLDSGKAFFKSTEDLDPSQISRVVEEAGYRVEKIWLTR